MNGDTILECQICGFKKTPKEILSLKIGKIYFKTMECEDCGRKGDGWKVINAGTHKLQK